jgi:hypothetical protein
VADGWRYLLANTLDMSIIGELRRAASKTLTVDNNKTGAVGFSYATGAPNAGDIYPLRTCIVAQRDDEWFWSGPVLTRNTSIAPGTATVGAVGWFERLNHILIQAPVTFTAQDAGSIASALLDLARAQDPTLPIRIGTVEVTQPRTITYNIDANIGQEIQKLAEIEAGYDWYVDPRTRLLNIVAKRGEIRANCKWLWLLEGENAKGNLLNVVENVDGSTVVNDIKPRGKFASGLALDLTSRDQYGLFQEAPSLSDVVDTNILNAYANAEIVYRSEPRVTYQIFPKSADSIGVPQIFKDYDIGDTTYLTARRDYINLNEQAIRIFGASMNITDEGVEQITSLKTTADG